MERPGPESPRARHAAPATELAVTAVRNLPVKWQPPDSRLILVAKSRGGVGATSVAVNLALELQKSRRLFGPARSPRVALVDFRRAVRHRGQLSRPRRPGRDARAPASPARSRCPGGAERDADASGGLKVLVAPRAAIPLEALDIPRVEAIVAALMAEFDYVVADLPPALVPWLEPLIARASRLLLVSDLSVPSVACTRRVLDLMREDNPDLATDIVVSREKKPMVLRKVHREAAAAIGLPLAHWLPDEQKLSRQALDRGEPLSLYAPRCAWAKAVRQIAASIRAERLTKPKA
jgi:pilus assembly protein CpaE